MPIDPVATELERLDARLKRIEDRLFQPWANVIPVLSSTIMLVSGIVILFGK